MSDIQTALDAIKHKMNDRQLFIDYYDGNHKLAFSTEKFKTSFGQTLKGLRDNLCPIVVDAPADRMEVINFAGDEEGKTVADTAWKLWQREQMELHSNEVHVEAIKTGCAYVIVWADKDNRAKFYLQDSRQCVVVKDEDTGDSLYAAKLWETKEKYARLTLYYPDRIEKYITEKKREQGGMDLKTDHFKPLEAQGEPNRIPNPHGIIPMFYFETNPVLNDAIPIQDCLNKTLADRMITQEFASFRQRWATGLEPPTDELTGVQKKIFDGGADRLWFTNEEKVKFGDFEATPLDPFLKASDSDRIEMARVTGTPLTYFGLNTSDAMSGEALKVLESRFTKKVKRLTLNFGGVWSKAMQLALRIENELVPDNLTAQWDAVESRSEKEMLEAAVIKQGLGVSAETIFEELGYTKEDIAKFTAEREQKAKADAETAKVNSERKVLRIAA